MGRLRKPTAIRIAEGNREHRPLPEREPVYDDRVPDCPRYLSPLARKYWRELSAVLLRGRVLTEADGLLLASLSSAAALLQEFQEQLNQDMANGKSLSETPNGMMVQNPLVGMVNKQRLIVQRLAAEFGLSPTSRTKVETCGAPKSADRQLADILSGKFDENLNTRPV